MSHWRRVAARVVAALFLVSLALALAQTEKQKPFVGNERSKKCHTFDCEWGKKISPKNLIAFATAEEAEKAGYVPCKIYRPGLKKR